MAAAISQSKLAELKLLSQFVLCTALPGLLFKLLKFGFCKWVCLEYLTDGLRPLPNSVLLILAARTLTPSEDRRIASLYRCAYNLPLSEKFTFVEIYVPIVNFRIFRIDMSKLIGFLSWRSPYKFNFDITCNDSYRRIRHNNVGPVLPLHYSYYSKTCLY